MHTQSARLNRRRFLQTTAAAAALVGAAMAGWTPLVMAQGQQKKEAFPMQPLPYPENALEPTISARTVSFHYGKHTKKYYDTTNEMVAGGKYAGMPLEEVFRAAHQEKNKKLFNNAAQAWNHTFYWNQFKPGGREFSGRAADAIKASFGGYEEFRDKFVKEAEGQFGSGYAWLVDNKGKLEIVTTPNAVNPLVKQQKPVLTVDVWEHAYYLDYQNKRGEHVKTVLDKLINWQVVAQNMA
ncbi:superoxide dismutase [Desulfocurvibacter africanus]|uniref:superoxide dismutase n=1 Tax=Desulfocurvibacter africanus TaxID=873 RepID=UPI00042326EF|nr:superoxide dismutase [Desulfocurvibacter africanus]